jgi:putative acetyltransferase
MSKIRAERAGDEPAIDGVHRAAFQGADEAELVHSLRKSGNARVSLVAEAEYQIIGHVLFSPVTIESCDASGLGLAPMAVLPSFQRQGVGSRLVEAGLAACRERGAGFVVVLGWPEFYPRFGFRRAIESGLGNEYGAEDEFMVLELSSGGLPPFRGTVRYGPEFAAFAN